MSASSSFSPSVSDPCLVSARELLEVLRREKICTPENTRPYPSTIFGRIRDLTTLVANQLNVPGPGLTSCIATTLFRLAACVELSQWFALEWMIKSRSQAVNLIFLGDPTNLGGDNHVLVFIGELKKSEELLIAKGMSRATLPKAEKFIPLADYFARQASEASDIVWVDPLLGIAGKISEKDEIFEIFETYCREHALTHVTGVKEYFSSMGLLENAERIKQNAVCVFRKAQKQLFEELTEDQRPALTTLSLPAVSAEIKIAGLIKKYKLTDASSLELEKALRNAAANNQLEDLAFLCMQSIDFNAQGPSSGKTALHVAVERGHIGCVQILLMKKVDIHAKDHEDKIPRDYARSREMMELLLSREGTHLSPY